MFETQEKYGTHRSANISILKNVEQNFGFPKNYFVYVVLHLNPQAMLQEKVYRRFLNKIMVFAEVKGIGQEMKISDNKAEQIVTADTIDRYNLKRLQGSEPIYKEVVEYSQKYTSDDEILNIYLISEDELHRAEIQSLMTKQTRNIHRIFLVYDLSKETKGKKQREPLENEEQKGITNTVEYLHNFNSLSSTQLYVKLIRGLLSVKANNFLKGFV